MTEESQNTIPAKEGSPVGEVTLSPKETSRFQGGARGRGGSRGGSSDRKPKREPRAKPEFDQRILDIRRVTRVSSGGRRFSFSVAMVVGNLKGSVGVATGKAGDTSLAIDKAYRAAKKSAVLIPLTNDMSIAHEVGLKYKSAVVSLRPAKGKGLVAGSAVRDVLELAGIKDVNAKIKSPSKNKLNIARATIMALQTLKQRKEKVVTSSK